MKVELFPFQKKAVKELRRSVADALNAYRSNGRPQVISLQAPTGAGKTIIISALIEDIYYGTEEYEEQPDAIFVWLSDSPSLNEQSKNKIDFKADKIKLSQCVVIEEKSFDAEMLDNGHIYFLNTQKLSVSGKLSVRGDGREYTIWETLANTVRDKSDRLYFIIDEAHRGMQGERESGIATSIMQRFLKGSDKHNMPPMPLVIGMSATPERFNNLVGGSGIGMLQQVVITANDVKASGLLKDRIIITYPEDAEKNNDMAVLQAATDEWQSKSEHWRQYSYEQHAPQINPVFVIQVCAGSSGALSDTNLDDVIAKIEERCGSKFKEHEVVHTFGSAATITLNGLPVHHVEAADIADDKQIRVVLFKENLSTGWDCPRAETMMSFRHAEDATYIAQLLGRMIRTPLQRHIDVDDSLNDVRLYLPYFNSATVKKVVDELQNSEGGMIPAAIEEETIEHPTYTTLTVYTKRRREREDVPGQGALPLKPGESTGNNADHPSRGETPESPQGKSGEETPTTRVSPSTDQPIPAGTTAPPQQPTKVSSGSTASTGEACHKEQHAQQLTLATTIDREAIWKFINEQAYLTYVVRSVRINSYLKSLLDLSALLTQSGIYPDAKDTVFTEITDMIRSYIQTLRISGKYDDLANKVLQFKLRLEIFDVFGEDISDGRQLSLFTTTDADLDRQLRIAEAKLANGGLSNYYGKRFYDEDDPNRYKIDFILFALDKECLEQLSQYAKNRFNKMNDTYRRRIVTMDESYKKQYSAIMSDGEAVSKQNLTLPAIYTDVSESDNGGKRYYNHLFIDGKRDDDSFVVKLNSSWEEELIEEESQKPDFVCWLRNKPRAKWALCLPYEKEGKMLAAYPDFIIVRSDPNTKYVIDILEPHNPEYKDNLGKAKALAKYADDEPRIGRVQLIRKGIAGKFLRLDMSRGEVREKVLKALNTDELDHIFMTDGQSD
nr:DEAD/DEAH box helicase family protein [Schwartzia sp. (in: firmicutes)]